ncbi:hypothetical protein CVT25_007833 [Psilocybe cyanescens]|uniref:Uncharacterized protein n=1 Tax=Psilocybe cyanescens TaxID=93625 RepID=A0A409VQ80_PSICY|nr:hypothetical protein CVT25_007833 [Psilocybe cyanescens]
MIAETATSDTMCPSPRPPFPYDPLQNLEQQIENYRQASVRGEKIDINEAADQVTLAMKEALHVHPDLTFSNEIRRKKRKGKFTRMMFPGAEDDDTPLKQVGRGVLTIILTPIAFAGMGIYAVGLIVEGSGTMLKGIGSIGRRAYVSPRRRSRSETSTVVDE